MVVLPQPPLLFAIRITMRDGLDERDWEPIPFAWLFCALFMPCLIRFFARDCTRRFGWRDHYQKKR